MFSLRLFILQKLYRSLEMLLQLILIFVFGKAQQAFSVKSQIVNMFGFVHAMQFLPELLNSAIAVQKQPEAIRR